MGWLSAFWTETDELDDNKIVDFFIEFDAFDELELEANIFVNSIFF